VSPEPAPAALVPQRCTLVLPSSGAFDSRAWRIASALAARGHAVTVMARQEPGLPADEQHPSGYRVVRVPVSAAAALPRPAWWLLGSLRRRRPRAAAGDAAVRLGEPSARVVSAPSASRLASPSRRHGIAGRLHAAWSAGIRLAAIALTVRSQRLATRPQAPRADLVHAMAYMGISIGLDLGRRDDAPVVYDARDIYVDAANLARLPGPARRLFGRIERRWARQASRVMTVNRPYAEVMAARFDVPLPAIVMNCSYRRTALARRPRRFHERLGLGAETRIVLYQGGLSTDRGIEQLIDALPALPTDVHLCLLGYGPLEPSLAAHAADPASSGRLHLLPAVRPDELLEWVASADVVAMPIQPTTLNHRLTTPNKLFEAMAVGVPVVASDLPGMAGIVRATGCGLVCDPTSPAAIATAIRALLDEPAAQAAARRERTLAAVDDCYNWEAQEEVLLAEYGQLTGKPW
jgi:glycosyltransferase involved in cell wall biosynthesis